MKVHLLFPDRDYDPTLPLPAASETVRCDLELDILFEAMCGDDPLLHDIVPNVVLRPLTDPATILYRQEILQDCIRNADVIRDLFRLTIEAVNKEKNHSWGAYSSSPGNILARAAAALSMFRDMLSKLRNHADANAGTFSSQGFTRFFSMLQEELNDEYLADMKKYLGMLRFSNGVSASAKLGRGLKAENYILHNSTRRLNLRQQLFGNGGKSYTYNLPDKDDNGARAMRTLEDEALNNAANAAAQSRDHILSFFQILQRKLSFYIGCLSLHDTLTAFKLPVALPEITQDTGRCMEQLYDVCLALRLQSPVAGNTLDATGKDLVMITGANQGGKTTFLRSIGQAQLLMQCGMFVPAAMFRANLVSGIATHFKQEEDEQMKSGKLDEELDRMSHIIDTLRPGALVLFNESFASTNEREGSEIAKQIVDALLDSGITICFVTHFYSFASDYYKKKRENYIFLTAEHLEHEGRTFRIIPGTPQKTAFGEEVYRNVFHVQN